jgi:site-specific recombinase XerC
MFAPKSHGTRFYEIPSVYLLEDGVNIRVVQEFMGHADVKTTEIYTHVMEKDIQAVRNPLETLSLLYW